MNSQPQVREIKLKIQSEFILNLVTFLTQEENFVFIGNESEIWLENLNHPRVQLIYINDQEYFTEARAFYISQKAQIIATQIRRRFLMPKVNFLVLNTCQFDGFEVENNQRHALTINVSDAVSAAGNASLQALFPQIKDADLTVSMEDIITKLQTETKVRANQEVALASLRTRPLVTYGFLLLNLIFFAFLQWRTQEQPDWFVELYYGSAFNPLIVDGEYWRLLTSNVMHLQTWHLAFNALFIFRYGPMIETVMGRWRMVVIILISGIMTSLAHIAFSTGSGIGASGVAFGFVGVFVFLGFEMRKAFMPFLKNGILPMLVFNALLLSFIPNVGHWGHLGGFIGGFAIAAIVGVKGVKPFWGRIILTVVTLAILISGLWIGAVNLSQSFFGG